MTSISHITGMKWSKLWKQNKPPRWSPGWMKSAAHRKNILDGDLIQGGVGIAMDERGMFYFTQIFLQPTRS